MTTEPDGILSYRQVEEKVLVLREQNVILDRDVAELYGVETKRVNEAVNNNPDKFPEGYLIDITKDEYQLLRSNFSTLESAGRGQHSKYLPKAFTEKGLYMLATILKSPKAAQTTIAIVETFAKIRELSRAISQLSETEDKAQQKALLQKSGEILAGVLDDDALEVSGDETTIEINFAIMKIKHTIRRGRRGKS
jgi:phage regulator Rha-like protein